MLSQLDLANFVAVTNSYKMCASQPRTLHFSSEIVRYVVCLRLQLSSAYSRLKKLGAPSHHLPISLIPSLSIPPHSLLSWGLS